MFVDLVNREMYFDDGLKSTAPPIALSSVKRSLELLLEIYPCHAALQATNTNTDFFVVVIVVIIVIIIITNFVIVIIIIIIILTIVIIIFKMK